VKLEIAYKGVGRNRTYYVTKATAGRPRHSDAIIKSKKMFATGATRSEAIANFMEMSGFEAAEVIK